MNRYIIETSHEKEDCLRVLDEFVVHGHITHFEWGCESGVHTGWAIVDAESEEQARYAVPSYLRSKAKVVKLSQFTPEKIQEFHEEIG